MWKSGGDVISSCIRCIQIAFISSLVLLGGFYEFTSCLIFCGLLVYMLVDNYKKRRKYVLGVNALCVIAIVVGYLTSIIFAVDRGMAFIGFVKYIPLIPLVILISQLDVEERKKNIQMIPLYGIVMTIVSAALSIIETASTFLNVNGNLAGFFQYPNTFALFLTIGLIVLADDIGTDKKKWIRSGIQALVLLLGIIASGSRTGWIMTGILCGVLLYRRNTRKMMIYLVVIFIGIAFIGLGTMLLCGVIESLESVVNVSMSTFYGRLLYMKDAISLVPMYPFGLGYWGYFFMQGQVQTGVYSVLYVHNDFLQMFLDAGWIAIAGLIVPIVRSLKLKELPTLFKTILVFMSLYMMLDFHLQYIAIFIILLLCLDYNATNKKIIVIHFSKVVQVAMVVMVLVDLYMGVALGCKYLGLNEWYEKCYPYDTEMKLEQLEMATTLEESNRIADNILKYNNTVSEAYGAKAEYAYSEYDFQALSEYKLEEIRLSPYTRGNYRELIDMMNVGMLMYEENDDMMSAIYCRDIITNVPYMLQELEGNTSYLGTKIDASPYLALSSEYIGYIEQLKE